MTLFSLHRGNGTQLKNDNRLTITHITNTQSSSLQISGLQYSDGGEYMCRVQYAMCPDGVDCREATPVTGRFTLNLPGATFFFPPLSGVTVTPDLTQPDSVSLTCSVASPSLYDYQYQWQWWKNGTQLNNDNGLTITHTTNTQSSSLQISGLQYSDEGEYMCRVQYAMCPDGVDCSIATRSITINLPGSYTSNTEY